MKTPKKNYGDGEISGPSQYTSQLCQKGHIAAMSEAEVRTLLVFISHADCELVAFPSVPTIARLAGLTTRSVWAAIRSLKKRGYIDRPQPARYAWGKSMVPRTTLLLPLNGGSGLNADSQPPERGSNYPLNSGSQTPEPGCRQNTNINTPVNTSMNRPEAKGLVSVVCGCFKSAWEEKYKDWWAPMYNPELAAETLIRRLAEGVNLTNEDAALEVEAAARNAIERYLADGSHKSHGLNHLADVYERYVNVAEYPPPPPEIAAMDESSVESKRLALERFGLRGKNLKDFVGDERITLQMIRDSIFIAQQKGGTNQQGYLVGVLKKKASDSRGIFKDIPKHRPKTKSDWHKQFESMGLAAQ